MYSRVIHYTKEQYYSMKTCLVIFALVAMSLSAQGREARAKLFHDHFLDFQMLIIEEAGQELERIAEQYLQFEDFLKTITYLETTDFKELVYEMEALPEFIEVVKFLENHNIDIVFFIDLINEAFDNIDRTKRISSRQQISGTDFNSYTNDVIDALPKDKLAALYDEKIAEDETFRDAMESLKSDEWDEIFGALWDSPVFQKEVDTLAENGVDVNLVIKQLIAVFGQL